jgi:hypothetical protein
MACGPPVVCSGGGALPELVGAAALSVDAESADALADALTVAITRVLTESLPWPRTSGAAASSGAGDSPGGRQRGAPSPCTRMAAKG